MGENKTVQTDQKMTFMQHLGALKNCIVIIAAVFVVAFVICFICSKSFLEVVLTIDDNYTFIQNEVTGFLTQQIKIAFIAALVIDAPVIIWQVHSFVSPGLTKNEDRKFLLVMVGGVALFAVGAIFCYFIVIPFTLSFFFELNQIDVVQRTVDMKNYISYIVSLLVSFGVVFEMPVVAALLASLGLIKSKVMASARRIVIVLCFLIGALITPPDIMSQCMVAGPMLLLYELSIHICKFIEKGRAKRMIAQGLDPDEEEEETKQESRWASAMAQVEMADARKAKAKSEKK